LPAALARVLVRLGVAGRGGHHVSTEHNRWQSHRAPTRLANALTLPLDGATWAVSDEARDSVRPTRLQERVVTLHHGADLARIRAAVDAPEAAPPPHEPGTFTFVHVANRRPNKAHEVLLDAFAIAWAEEPALRLWLVGQWLDTEEFTALVAANPAREAITVLGARPDAPALIAAADAMVLSSDHEGLPVAIMESFALGRPVVSTSVGGVPEAVRDDREGLLVAPRDPAALAAAMVRLAREPELVERLSAGASARADVFDARHAQDVQVAAYRRLAESGP
jgi:glycosyltransferase involved in cell wall biosynthesis